jgi:hypothetical protein
MGDEGGRVDRRWLPLIETTFVLSFSIRDSPVVEQEVDLCTFPFLRVEDLLILDSVVFLYDLCKRGLTILIFLDMPVVLSVGILLLNPLLSNFLGANEKSPFVLLVFFAWLLLLKSVSLLGPLRSQPRASALAAPSLPPPLLQALSHK